MTRTFRSAAIAVSTRRATGLAAAAAIAVAALAGGNALAATTTPHATTLHYTLHFSPLTVIDVGAKGNSLGDEIVSHDIVYSTAGKRVGYDAQTCMFTSLSHPVGARSSSLFRAERSPASTSAHRPRTSSRPSPAGPASTSAPTERSRSSRAVMTSATRTPSQSR